MYVKNFRKREDILLRRSKMKAIFFLCLFLFFSIMEVVCMVWERNRKIARLLRPFLMPALLLFYWSAAEKPSPFLIGALLLCFLGDVFLLGKSDLLLACGYLSFLFAHVLYGLFFSQSVPLTGFHPGLMIIIFYILAFQLLIIRLQKGMEEKRKFQITKNLSVDYPLPVKAYGLFIMSMSYLSFIRAFFLRTPGAFLAAGGTLLFILSDALLALAFFQKKSDKAVMATYLAGQLFIVFGVLMG